MNFFRSRSKSPIQSKHQSSNKKSDIGKSTSQRTLKYNPLIQLPQNFAEDLMEYEMELEKKVINIKTINKILELYSVAIEYYESMNDDRYLIFKNKMSSLWLRPNVLQVLNECEQQTQQRTNKFGIDHELSDQKNIQIAQNQKTLDIQLLLEQQRDVKHNPKGFIQKYNEQQIKRDQVIENENMQQRIQLLKRIKERQKSISPSMKRQTKIRTEYSDESCETPKFNKNKNQNKNQNQQLQQKGIGQKFFEKQVDMIEKQKNQEREIKIKQINEKAETQLKLIEQQIQKNKNNELLLKVVEKIKREQKEQIQKVEMEISQQYESLIQHLK